jgi:hypothetical protein
MAMGIGPVNADVRAAQEQMNASMLTSMRPFVPILMVSALLQLVLAIGFLYGGIRALNLDPLARQVLLWSCAVAFGLEIGHFVVATIMQLQLLPVMEQHMGRVMEASSNSGNMQQFGTAMARISMIAGLVFSGIWMLLKLVYFWISWSYLRQPQVRTLFGAGALP